MHDESDVEEMRRAMADATAAIPIRDVRRLDVRPGDTLLVRVPRTFTVEDYDQTRRQFLGLFGDAVKVIITPDDVDVTVVRRADA